MPQSRFGKTLRILRASIHPTPTLKQIADHSDVTQPTMSRYESGEQEPQIGTAQKIAGFFGLSLAEFMNYRLPEEIKADNEEDTLTLKVKLDPSPTSLEQAILRLRTLHSTYFSKAEAA